MFYSEIRNKQTTFSTLETGSGEPILFLHGFPDNNKTFSQIMEPIARQGYHCVAPIMRGYEPKTISHWSKLHINDLVLDILGWMDDRGWDHVHLVGHNWGAVIAYAAGIYYPMRISSITAIGVPLLKNYQETLIWAPQQSFHSWYLLLFQIPFLAELTIRSNHFAMIDYLWKDWSPELLPNQDHLAEIKNNFQNPGVLSSALSYYRNLNDLLTETGRESILGILDAVVGTPTQVLYGEEDGCFHRNLFEQLLKDSDFPQGLKKSGFENCGHFLHWEEPETVAEEILSWVKKNKYKF
ncbi:alpha/beta fold hydrolase [Leptospira ilyithenensis]|uniref:Alpha/beta hydrolase n=1 Tax=Leptospira ilyithenensis TaxID=2484901 RepID=A0A4R9LR30_9LEPT|nr:alpha/beta hydrolase [Leptospira ilyithenensis]TGN10953.1 alpha/beta hydrolase [Leptospira ilyithenensis]